MPLNTLRQEFVPLRPVCPVFYVPQQPIVCGILAADWLWNAKGNGFGSCSRSDSTRGRDARPMRDIRSRCSWPEQVKVRGFCTDGYRRIRVSDWFHGGRQRCQQGGTCAHSRWRFHQPRECLPPNRLVVFGCSSPRKPVTALSKRHSGKEGGVRNRHRHFQPRDVRACTDCSS